MPSNGTPAKAEGSGCWNYLQEPELQIVITVDFQLWQQHTRPIELYSREVIFQ